MFSGSGPSEIIETVEVGSLKLISTFDTLSKTQFFDLEVLYFLKTTKIKTVLTSIQLVCVTRPTRRHLGAIRARLGPVGGALREF